MENLSPQGNFFSLFPFSTPILEYIDINWLENRTYVCIREGTRNICT